MDIKRKDNTNLKAKKSRLIIRNLSFKAKEDDLRKIFSPFGQIVDISLPKKEDGKLKGFAFLSFDNVKSSLKAIKHLNGKDYLNRTIAVDFAVPKDIYTKCQKNQNNTIENEKEEDDDEENSAGIEDNSHEDNGNDSNSEDESEGDNDNDDDDENKSDEEKIQPKTNRKPSDVKEGKTIFIRNLDFETNEESVENLFKSFGDIEYCKICYDEYNGSSKGSAFVKFKNKDDAQKCIEEAAIPENVKFHLDGKSLIVTPALSRNQLNDLRTNQIRKNKDKRNLYLAKEGLIYPDSPAAVGVSQNDLKKRLMLEEKKRRLLQNLHNFISDRRLCIHNLPSNYDDAKLKKLFLKAANDKNAKILWAKVMKNRNKTDKKFTKSKGFGFVEFNDHVYALKALRCLNNNPEIFTPERRPIVEFSVENKVALNLKKYRLLKQEKIYSENRKLKKNNRNAKPISNIGNLNNNDNDHQVNEHSFCGVLAKPFENNQKVIKSKINRKILEQRKKLKSRGKKLKSIQKFNNNNNNNNNNTNGKIKVKKQLQEKKSMIDDLEEKYLTKQKSKISTNSNNNNNLNNFVRKKQKWYLQ